MTQATPPMSSLLSSIESPADVRRLSRAQLPPLAEELRSFLLQSVARTGGHLSSNLGTVELTLASTVNEGETVTFTYTAPSVSAATSNSAIQDLAGNDAASVSSATSVTNITDVTAPVRQSAVVNAAGTSLTLTYNEALGSTTAATGDFVVRVGGSSRSVTGVAVSGSTVVLTLSPVVQQNEEVTVAYTAPASDASATNNAIQDSVGNDAVSFTAIAATNGRQGATVATVSNAGAVAHWPVRSGL